MSLESPKLVQTPMSLRLADTFFARLWGLHRTTGFEPHNGLWLYPCRMVHTLGLRQEIDVVFLDAEWRILRLVLKLKPNRWASCWRARSVVELPGGSWQGGVQCEQLLRMLLKEASATPVRGFRHGVSPENANVGRIEAAVKGGGERQIQGQHQQLHESRWQAQAREQAAEKLQAHEERRPTGSVDQKR